jgi:hypothetical protein
MKGVELYAQVRYAVQIEGVSRREAARRFGIDPRTVAKMLAFSVPPGYRRSRPPARSKLDPFTRIIGILAADEGRPRKQRHTSKRIFERLLRLGQPGEVSGMVPIAGGACSQRGDDCEGTIRLPRARGSSRISCIPKMSRVPSGGQPLTTWRSKRQ